MAKTYLRYTIALLVLTTIVCCLSSLSPVQAAGQQYTVTFKSLEYAENLPAAQTASLGTVLVLSDTIPKSPECRFIGWSIVPYGEVIYKPGDSYTDGTDITLYAVWVVSCGKCHGTGQTTTTCSLCNGSGEWWGNVSLCCSSKTTLVSITHGSSLYRCTACGKVCNVEYGCANCETTMQVICQRCYGDTYLKITPKAPQPQLLSSTSSSITLVPQPGMEYSIDGNNWQSSNTFTGLMPCTSYKVYQRYPGSTYYEEGERSPWLEVSTGKYIPSPPEAPIIESIYSDRIVLQYNYLNSYEYSMDGVSWTSINIFENLEPNTFYTFYQRTAKTDTTDASEASPGVTVKTAGRGALVLDSASGAPGDTVTLNLNMPENPHLVYLSVTIEYDWLTMDLIGMDDKELLYGFHRDVTDGRIFLCWEDTNAITNNTETGSVISLSFKIIKTPQEGCAPITISSVSSWDKDFKINGFSTTSGKINIACKSHEFGEYDSNNETHWRTCYNCEYKETSEHKFNSPCEGICIICNASVRKETHNFVINRDNSGHWYECSICKTRQSLNFHVPGPEATDETAQICLDCGYIITPALNHEHAYSPNFTTNDTAHWYACSGCEETTGYAEHKFENACSAECSVCGYTREVKHNYSRQWTADQHAHWHECIFCGEKYGSADHIPGPEGTETEVQICTVCGYELAPSLNGESTVPTTVPTTDATPSGGSNTILWISIVIISSVACGSIVFILTKRKSN